LGLLFVLLAYEEW